MRKTKDEAEFTRQKLLQAGYELILEKGYERMTREDIARRVNMTRGAVNWHFKTKEDIYIAILTNFLDDLALRRQEIYNSHNLTVEERLTALYTIPLQEWEKFNFINQIPVYLLKLESFQAIQQRMTNNRLEFLKYLHVCLDELEIHMDTCFSADRESVVSLLYFLYEGLYAPSSNVLFDHRINTSSVENYLRYLLSKLNE